MAGPFPLGYDINIQPIDQQFGVAAQVRPDRTEDIVSVTGEEISTEDAKARITENNKSSVYDLFIRGYKENKTADQLQQEAENLGLKQDDFNSSSDFVIEQALTLGDYEYSAVDARMATNYQIANEIIMDRMQEIGENKGTFGNALDTVDRFIRAVSPIGLYEDITAETESNSQLILDKAATLSPKEFRQWFDGFADDVAQEGLFTSNTLAAFRELGGEVSGAGYDPNKGYNQLLAALDIATAGTTALAVRGAKAAVKSTLKSSTAVGRVAAVKGPEAASQTAEAILRVAPDPVTLGNVAPSVLDNLPQAVRPSQSMFSKKFAESKIIQEIDDMFKKGAFGRVASKEQIQAAANKIAETYRKSVSSPTFDFKVFDQGLGNYVTSVRFGRAMDGNPFKPLANGEPPESLKRFVAEVQQKVERAEIVPVDPNDLKKGYVVEVTERISTSGLPEAINEIQDTLTGTGFSGAIGEVVRNTVGKVMNNSVMGSAALRDVQRLNTLANMAESSRAAVKGIIQPYIDKISKLNGKERYTVQAVYTQLRDGADASLRVRYTKNEFYVKYKQMHPNGEAPSQRAYEAYQALAEVEEATYLIKTHNMLQRWLEKGYQNTVEVYPGYFSPAKRVRRADIPADAKIVDGASGAKIRIQDIESEDFPIWKIDKPTSDGQEYVVDPRTVRLIDPTDVMGYNPGGSRTNPNLNYFVVLGEKRLKAMLGTFTENQARLAAQQLRNLQEAIRNGTLTDELVQANNDWNPGVQTVEQLNQVMADEGWDLTRGNIGFKGRNDDILDSEVEGEQVFVGMKADDYVQNDMRRNDKVLMDFGGGRAYNEDPINSILAQTGQAVFTYSNRAYARNAMVGWVKRVQQMNRSWLRTDIPPNDYERLFRTAEVKGNDQFATRMKELREITLRKLNMEDEFATWMEGVGQQFAEYVFDKTGKQLNLGDPTNIMLKIGFQSAFGFMNVSQLLMQSFHATSIMAISPIHGIKGAALTVPLRGALRGLAKGAPREEIIKRWAKATGTTEKEAEDWLEFIRTSGRTIVDGDAIEDGTGIGFGISGWKGEDMRYTTLSAAKYNGGKFVGKGLDAGLLPFKAGERLSRMTGLNTAISEFKAKFPNASILSDEARQWITRREQDLTFNMSSLSRGKFQSGFMKVPTQWLSYTMRAMEAVFVGRNFTAAERGRLFVMLAPFYGLTGFGLANAADYIAEKAGFEPGGGLYIALKYGMLDALVAELSPVEIGLGERLAPFGAITDTYDKITEGRFLEVLGGPSGEITVGLWDSFSSAFNALANGQTATLTEDVIKLLRTPSGLDNVAKAYGIFNNGIYRSKTGISLPYEMSIGDGLVALGGFTPLEVVENYNRLDQVFTSSKKFTDFRKEVNRDADYVFQLMTGDVNDINKAIELTKELDARISFSGFSLSQQADLRASTTNMLASGWQRIQDNLIQQDKLYALEATRSILQGDDK